MCGKFCFIDKLDFSFFTYSELHSYPFCYRIHSYTNQWTSLYESVQRRMNAMKYIQISINYCDILTFLKWEYFSSIAVVAEKKYNQRTFGLFIVHLLLTEESVVNLLRTRTMQNVSTRQVGKVNKCTLLSSTLFSRTHRWSVSSKGKVNLASAPLWLFVRTELYARKKAGSGLLLTILEIIHTLSTNWVWRYLPIVDISREYLRSIVHWVFRTFNTLGWVSKQLEENYTSI